MEREGAASAPQQLRWRRKQEGGGGAREAQGGPWHRIGVGVGGKHVLPRVAWHWVGGPHCPIRGPDILIPSSQYTQGHAGLWG